MRHGCWPPPPPPLPLPQLLPLLLQSQCQAAAAPPLCTAVTQVPALMCRPACLPAVFISGANISSTYLATRQDRYLVLRAAPQLAAFLRQAAATVGRFSYQLQPLGASGAEAEAGTAASAEAAAIEVGAGAVDGGGGSSAQQRPRRRDLLLQLLKEQRLPWQQQPKPLLPQHQLAQQPPQQHHHLQRHRLQRQQRYRLAPCPVGVDPVLQAPLFCQHLRRELLQLFVPQAGWQSVLDFAVLHAEEEAAEAAAEAAVPPDVGQRQQRGWHSRLGGESSAARSSGSSASCDSGAATGQGLGLPAAPAAAAAEAEAAAAADTWIVPMVQAGFAGVRQEERCTLALLQWAMQQQQQHQQQPQQAPQSGTGARTSSSSGSGRVLLQLASPYLNLARPYESFLSRQARGFCCCH